MKKMEMDPPPHCNNGNGGESSWTMYLEPSIYDDPAAEYSMSEGEDKDGDSDSMASDACSGPTPLHQPTKEKVPPHPFHVPDDDDDEQDCVDSYDCIDDNDKGGDEDEDGEGVGMDEKE